MKDLFPSRRKKPKIKLLCSFHGKVLPRPLDGKLRYTGGETRIISVERSISFFKLKSKVLELIRCPNKYIHSLSFQYQISDSNTEEHSALVLIESDDDVRCMIDAYERLEFYGKHYRLWIFVCDYNDVDDEYVNLQKLDYTRFRKFDGYETLSCELGIEWKNNEIVGAKNRIHVKSGKDELVKNNPLLYYCGGHLGCDKVRKLVTSGQKVKSNEDSLRKVVLKQQLSGKRSALSKSLGSGLGLDIEQATTEISSFDNENYGTSGVSLSSERETPLTCDSAFRSSYRSNTIDYKYNDDTFIDSRSSVNSVPSSVSHSRPLNPKDGNSGAGINARKFSNCNQRYSIGVLPCPKPYSIMGCYDTLCESSNIEPATLSNLNRENIMPWAVGSMTPTAGLVPLSHSNELLGGLSTISSSYDRSYHGIRNQCFGQGDARNQRIYHHSRSHYSTEVEYHRNVRVDGRPSVGKFYPGIQSSPVISKQGQVVKSSHPTMLKPWSDSHNQQREGDMRPSHCILDNLTCSLSFPYGSEENLTEHSDLGLPQDIKPEHESHKSYHYPLNGMADQSHFALTNSKNFPGCTEVNALNDYLSSCVPNQHDATNYQDVATCGPNRPKLECNAKISKADDICKSFRKHQTGPHISKESITPSMDFTLHNLAQLSLDDLKLPTHSTSSSSSREALVKPQPMALELMDKEHLGSSPHVQISSDKATEFHEENEQETAIQQDVESALSIVEKDEIKKACNGYKANGDVPTELATVYNHLATRKLQTIKNSDLEYIKELGSGTYGTVFYGKWKGSDVAIKRIKPSCFNGGVVEENRLIADFWKEAYILGQLRHPNIVALFGVVTDGPATNLATVTEFMVNGSLKQVFCRKDRTIDRRKRIILAMGAAFGMEYLHEKNIVHFDLKSHNLLVNMRDPQRPVCKIGDLGLSKIKQKTPVSGGVRGTIPWMAPELLNSQNLVTEKVDVYSFGIVMWELLTGEEPYANMRSHEVVAGIMKGTLRPEIPCWCDPAWRSLMEKCWSADADNRPAFSEIAKELRTMAAAMNIK